MRNALLLLALASLTPACADNSGGPVPDGEPTSFSILEGDWSACAADSAVLRAGELADVADNCAVGASRDLLLELDANLTESEAVVFMQQQVPCGSTARLEDLLVDGDAVVPWVLAADPDYGTARVTDESVLCIFEAVLLVDELADTVSEVAPVVGVYNPNRPGAPE